MYLSIFVYLSVLDFIASCFCHLTRVSIGDKMETKWRQNGDLTEIESRPNGDPTKIKSRANRDPWRPNENQIETKSNRNPTKIKSRLKRYPMNNQRVSNRDPLET